MVKSEDKPALLESALKHRSRNNRAHLIGLVIRERVRRINGERVGVGFAHDHVHSDSCRDLLHNAQIHQTGRRLSRQSSSF